MAVQQLGKKQAKKEKKNQKALDDEFARDEEKALEDTQRMIDLMEKIYKDEIKTEPEPSKPAKIRNPGGPIIKAKDGGMMLKTYDNVEDAKEALKKAPPGSMILATGKPGNETYKIIQIGPGPGGTIVKKKRGGSVEGKRLTKTVPPKKGPNSQGMRGTGAAIRGTKFKGVF